MNLVENNNITIWEEIKQKLDRKTEKFYKIKNYLIEMQNQFNNVAPIDFSTLAKTIKKNKKLLELAEGVTKGRQLLVGKVLAAGKIDGNETLVPEAKEISYSLKLAIITWSINRNVALAKHADKTKDFTLLKIISTAVNIKKYKSEASKIGIDWKTNACGLSNWAVTKKLSNTVEDSDLFTYSDTPDELKSQFGKGTENLFNCNFRGIVPHKNNTFLSHTLEHAFLVHEKKIGDEYKYRVYCSYVFHYTLENFLAASEIDSKNGNWMTLNEMNQFLAKVDRFINSIWTEETVADYFNCFGVTENHVGKKLDEAADRPKFGFLPIKPKNRLFTVKNVINTVFVVALSIFAISRFFRVD